MSQSYYSARYLKTAGSKEPVISTELLIRFYSTMQQTQWFNANQNCAATVNTTLKL